MPKVLTEAEIEQWRTKGAIWPIDLLHADEARELRARYEALDDATEGGAQSRYRIKAHLPFPWLWDVITRDRLVDAIEDLLGPDFVCWGSSFFAKKAHDPSFISWHQDSTYYGLEPPESVTAWIAFTDATSESGCMKIISGSQLGPTIREHDEIPDPNNMLVRGQTVRDADESLAVEMPLAAGQMSIHHNKTIHSSEPNRADWPRIGFAVHFAATDVRQAQFDGATAILLRGSDPKHNWLPDPEPRKELDPDCLAALDEAWGRYQTAMRAQR